MYEADFIMKFKKTYIWNKIKTAKDALLWALAKWHLFYLEGRVIDYGSGSCACCGLYIDVENNKKENCVGCPVSKYAKSLLCENTPYNKACEALYLPFPEVENPVVKEEMDFLIQVYERYFGEFSIKEFESGPYEEMKNYLKDKFGLVCKE